MNRLSRVSLKGFKSIREMGLDLGVLNVLIGPNGSGKSNFLSFFRMLSALAQGRLSRHVALDGGSDMILHYGSKRTPEIEVKVSVTDGQREVTYSVTLRAAPPDTFFLDGEELVYGGEKAVAFSFSSPRPHGREEEELIARAVDGLTHYHFHDTSKDAPIRQACHVDDNRSLRDNGGNLAAFLYMLKLTSREHYVRIRDTIRLVTPFFEDFVLEPKKLDAKTIQLEWRARDSAPSAGAANHPRARRA